MMPSSRRRLPSLTDRALTLSTRLPWLSCLLACALWFALTLSLRPLAIPDEGRYVGVAWEMLRSGHWSVPTLDGMPFFHKPPLFYWIAAAAMELFGPGVAAARMAPWLAAVATTTGLYAFLSRWVGERVARRSALVLATMPLFYGGSQYANLDMLVAGCIASTVLCAAHATLSREAGRPHRLALAGAFAAAALGVLSKGLIGAVLPLLVLLGWGLSTRRLARVAAVIAWAPGWAMFAVIAAPWFILMQDRFSNFFHYFFVVQQFQRFQATGFNNPQPIWFYLAVLLLLTVPWSLWLSAALVKRLRGERAAASATATARDAWILMVVWLVVITAFFSVPDSKLIGYILPVLAPLAALIAACVPSTGGRWLIATSALAGVVCVGAVVAAHYGQPKSRAALAEQLRQGLRPGEPVIFLSNYYYDVGFYARLRAPALVVDDWTPAELAKDSWRRELADSESFAEPGSTRVRYEPKDLAKLVCGAAGAWIVGPAPTPKRPAWLATAALVFQDDTTSLWHVVPTQPASGAALGCAQLAPGAESVTPP